MTSPPVPPQATAMCECSHHWRMHAESGLTSRSRICHGTTGSATPGPYQPCNCGGFAPWDGPIDARTGEPVRPLRMVVDARQQPASGTVPPQAITAEMVAAAQAHDYASRPPHWSWARVPDDQVARLLAGAAPHLAAAHGHGPHVTVDPGCAVCEQIAQAVAAEREKLAVWLEGPEAAAITAGAIRAQVDQEITEAVAAERERLRTEIDPGKLSLLADWFDADDALKEAGWPVTPRERGHEVQDDLRRWAALLREAP